MTRLKLAQLFFAIGTVAVIAACSSTPPAPEGTPEAPPAEGASPSPEASPAGQ